MSKTVSEMKATSIGMWKKRKRLRAKNAGKRRKRMVSGKSYKTTAATYRKLIRRNQRPRKASTIRKALRTRKIRARKFGKSYGRINASQHSDTFLAAITEFAVQTKNPALAAEILEMSDPSITSTKLGHFALEIAENLDKNMSETFLDMFILEDNKTICFVFEQSKANPQSDPAVFEAALSGYGKTTALASPGDDLGEGEASNVYLIAVTVESKRLDSLDTDLKESEIAEGMTDEAFANYCNETLALLAKSE